MRPLQSPRRLAGPALAAIALATLLLSVIAGVASAKESMSAVLDAPIALASPPGAELLVGLTVDVLTEDGEYPVEGSPIVLILSGRDGETTEAWSVQDRIGHYVARATVPDSGVRGLRVVLRGTSDIDILLLEDPFTFGGISPRSAQVAPAPTPGLTPLPRATAVAKVPAASAAPAPVEPASAASEAAPAPAAAAPAPAVDGTDGATWWPPALVLVVLGVVVVVAVRLRVGRRSAEGA